MTWPRFVFRNLFRRPWRTAFTTVSITLSIFLVCAVLTLPSALDAILERAASNVRISVCIGKGGWPSTVSGSV